MYLSANNTLTCREHGLLHTLFLIERFKLNDKDNPKSLENGVIKINKINYTINFLMWLVILVIIIVIMHFIVK